jgi:hypothetical protein
MGSAPRPGYVANAFVTCRPALVTESRKDEFFRRRRMSWDQDQCLSELPKFPIIVLRPMTEFFPNPVNHLRRKRGNPSPRVMYDPSREEVFCRRM